MDLNILLVMFFFYYNTTRNVVENLLNCQHMVVTNFMQ